MKQFMDLTIPQMIRLRELREAYAFDVATAKQHGKVFKDVKEELEVLSLLDLSRHIQIGVEKFAKVVEISELAQFVLLGTVCNEAVGKIAKNLEHFHPVEEVDKALDMIDERREKFRNP